MMIYIRYDNTVQWIHPDDNTKQLPEYINDENAILTHKIVDFINVPDDGNEYVQKWNPETEEIYLECLGPLPKPPVKNEDIMDTVNILSEDSMLNIELGVDTNQKVALSQEDGLLIMELLLDIQNQLAQRN